MAKEDFCFTYYDGDATRDTYLMDRLTKGAYADLIRWQVHNGHFSINDVKDLLDEDFKDCWGGLSLILHTDNDNKYFIKWLDDSLKAHKSDKVNKETFVYAIKLSTTDECFIKIGISNNLKKRYSDYIRLGFTIEEILTISFGNRIDAEDAEIKLHSDYSSLKYIPLKRFAGQTECFSINLLNSLINA